jgi:hypothetical protein
MSLFAPFIKAIDWIVSLLHKAKDGLAKATVFILQDIKPLLDSNAADLIAGILDSVTKSDLPEEILAEIRKYIPVFLTANGIIDTLTPDSTEAEVQAELQKLIALFPNLTPEKKAQFYTTVAANLYVLIHKLHDGDEITFAEAVAIIEQCYDEYVASKA